MSVDNGYLLRYHKYFDNWDKTASVRSKPNRYKLENSTLKQELQDKNWFLPAGVPMLSHPFLKNIESEKEQYLLGRFLLQFLEYGTILEHEFVNTILVEIALGEWGIPIPEEMRLDAFKIYTDEAYHACFNLDATQQIRNYIGLKSNAWPLKNTRLKGLRNLIPENKTKENFLIRFGIAAISETIAAKELAENMKGIVIDSIYNIFIDHAEDEKKHCMFFTTLFEYVWKYLSADERKYLGINLPKILKAFVDINTIALYEALEEVGFDKEDSNIIISESYPKEFSVQRALSVASVTFRIFQKLNIYSIPEVREAFIKEGFPVAA